MDDTGNDTLRAVTREAEVYHLGYLEILKYCIAVHL